MISQYAFAPKRLPMKYTDYEKSIQASRTQFGEHANFGLNAGEGFS